LPPRAGGAIVGALAALRRIRAMTAQSAPPPHRRLAGPWFVVEGVLLIVLGVLAAALPALAGVAGALVFGWVLIMAGVFGLAGIFGSRHHAHLALSVASALIALAAGALIVWSPLVGAVTLAILIAVYLLFDGVALIGLAMDQRKRAARGWPWLIVSGGLDIVLGLVILALGARADATLLGFLIALDLIVAGLALAALGLHARRAV
jgi:uncharacterized membrane protein HdeD (DUF308 family)